MKYKQSSQSGMITTPTFKLLSVTKAKVNSYINSLSVSLSKQHSKQSVPLKSQCQGFSLVETLVAITILLIIIIGPMTISSSTARSTSFASEQVVAYFLAQEGAELAQKARDDFLLENFYVDSSEPYIGWDKFTDDGGGTYKQCFSNNGCGLIVANTNNPKVVNKGECTGETCQIKFDPTPNGPRSRYTYNINGQNNGPPNESTPYTRVIKLEKGANDNEVRVESRVTWYTGNQRQQQEVVVDTYLYNIYAN